VQKGGGGDGIPLTSQQTSYLARVRRHGNVRALVAGKHVVEHRLGPHVLRRARLGEQRRPERIALCEAPLEADVRPRAATVARVRADALAEALLDGGRKGGPARQGEPREGQARGGQAAAQRAGVVRLGRGDLLVREQVLPEAVGCVCLLDARGRELRVGPGGRVVAVALAPVAVPRGRAEEGFRGIVVAFAVAAEEEQRVALCLRGEMVQARDVVGETLPAGCVLAVGAGAVAGVGLVDEAEVGGREVEGRGVGRGVVLQEDAGYDGVVGARLHRVGRRRRGGESTEEEGGAPHRSTS